VLPGLNNAAGGLIVRGGAVRVGNDLGFGPVPSVPLSGAIQLDHGGLAFPGSFRIGANRGIILNSGGGSFDVSNFQAVAVDGKLEGPGTLTKTGTGTLILSGAYNSTGGMDVQQGVLQIKEGASAAQTIIAGHVSVAPGATITQAGSTKFTDRADIDGGVFAGSQTAEFAGVLAGAGSLNSFGAGQILVTGQLSPGHSVGHLFAGGTVSLAGDYYAEIGGTNAADYDQLIVNGTANLGGSLSVVLLNDFQPHYGDVFQLVSATNFSGNFSAENLPSLANGLNWDISQLGSTGSLSVVPEPTTLALLLCAAPLAARRLRRAVSEKA
jgi:fibronectin-binding autotransporter adhesin